MIFKTVTANAIYPPTKCIRLSEESIRSNPGNYS
jgi:hypothetical protein